MTDKKDSKKIEREYVIPLREKCRPVPRYKKTPKAIKTIKEFLARHMSVENRDLKKVRLDKYLNEYIWGRGIKKPQHKVKVKAVKEDGIVRAELVDYPDKLKFKKLREIRLTEKAEASKKKKAPKTEVEKKSEETEEVKEIKEKIEALKEEGEKFEEGKAKAKKHTTKPEKSKTNSAREAGSNQY